LVWALWNFISGSFFHGYQITASSDVLVHSLFADLCFLYTLSGAQNVYIEGWDDYIQNDELVGKWKEALVAFFKVLFRNLP
jgi:predicted SnoaL-like aldol condensation-catalyzing enzyme